MYIQNIAVITVNYETADLAIEAIKSVAQEKQYLPNIQMYVVDNCSGDNSVEQLKEFVIQEELNWVTIIASTVNGGFASGNNVVLEKILSTEDKPDFVWFLNPDTKLRPQAGSSLLQFMLDEGVSIAGSRLEDEDGTPQISNFNFPNVISELCNGARLGILDRLFRKWITRRELSEIPEKCDWLAGASLMMSFKVIEQIGLMDEEYFLYFEEVDYCLQAHRAGFDCWYVPASRVYHAVGASTRISESRKAKPRIPSYWFDSRRRYFLKNHGAIALILADTFFIFGYCTWLLRKALVRDRQMADEPPKFLRDFVKNSFIYRGISVGHQ